MKLNDIFIDNELYIKLSRVSLYSDIITTRTFKRLKDISFLGAIDYISKTKKRHNRYTHSISVGTLALHYATLKKLSDYETKHLVVAALLHDVGHGPLSHSMERAFVKKYNISHHTNTNKIIKGEISLGRELYRVLKDHSIDIEYIIALLDGKVSNTTSFALDNPINIDTADGIIRSISYAFSSQTKKRHLSFLPKPKDVVEALVFKNKAILDEFWKLKHRVYSTVIHKPENLSADVVSLNFANKTKSITKDDFLLTDREFKNKYISVFEQIQTKKMDELKYTKRYYFVTSTKNKLYRDADIYEIYKSKKEDALFLNRLTRDKTIQKTLF